MASSNVCWGVEVGAGAIKALKLQRDGDDLRVLDFVVLPHKLVLSTPDLDQGDARPPVSSRRAVLLKSFQA